MTCCHCFKPFDSLSGVDPNRTVAHDDLILCGYCGHVNVVSCDSVIEAKFSTRQITQQEFIALPKSVQLDLDFALRLIVARYKKENKKLILPKWYQKN